MIAEPQNEAQRFLCALGRARGFSWADELPQALAASCSAPSGYTSIDLYDAYLAGHKSSIFVPEEPARQTPIEGAFQRSKDAGFSHHENSARLQNLENLRAYLVRLILGNPLIKDELDDQEYFKDWPVDSSAFQGLCAPIMVGLYDPRAPLSQGERFQNVLRAAEISNQLASEIVQAARQLADAIIRSDSRWQTAFHTAIDALDQQQNELVRGNLLLVMKYSRSVAGKIDRAAAIRAGIAGLLEGITRYESHHNTTLATYAVWWIKQTSRRASQNHKAPLRLPVHRSDRITKLWRSIYELWAKSLQPPSVEDLMVYHDCSYAEVRALVENSRSLLSIEAFISSTGTCLADELHDPGLPTPALIFQSEAAPGLLPMLRKRLEDVCMELQAKRKANVRDDSKVIAHRYGVGVAKDFTLEEIGSQYGISRQRIEQIQKREKKNIRLSLKRQKIELPADLSLYMSDNTVGEP